MGIGYSYKCEKCGHDFEVFLGIGMMFPMQYEDTLKAMRDGKYGAERKKICTNEQYIAVDAETHLYKCEVCGSWKVARGLDLYVPKSPDVLRRKMYGRKSIEEMGYVPYVTGHDLSEDYKLVKRYMHKCSKCGKRMRKTDGYNELESLPCPKCGSDTIGMALKWD